MSRALAAAALAFGLSAAGCSSMKASVEIDAPAQQVWEVLADLEHYHCWNPFFVRFTQDEAFSGMLVPFAGFEPYRAGWERMNAALKLRAERLAASRQSVR